MCKIKRGGRVRLESYWFEHQFIRGGIPAMHTAKKLFIISGWKVGEVRGSNQHQ